MDSAVGRAGFSNDSATDPGSVRVSYSRNTLDDHTLHEHGATEHWLPLLQAWYAEAAAHPWIAEPNAIQLATVDSDGNPDARTVLARDFDEAGITFYTNYSSAKAQQLAAHPRAAIVFSWLPMERQVRLRGTVAKVPRAETQAYFATRPRGSQLGAWASPQSRVIASRAVLEDLLAEQERRFADRDVEPPPDWGGYRLTVEVAEFWQGREFRLHDRLRYSAAESDEPAAWIIERLAP